MKRIVLLAGLVGCCGGAGPATRPSWSYVPGALPLVVIPPRVETPQYFGSVVPGIERWVRIPADAAKKNVGMNTEHYVIPLMARVETETVAAPVMVGK